MEYGGIFGALHSTPCSLAAIRRRRDFADVSRLAECAGVIIAVACHIVTEESEEGCGASRHAMMVVTGMISADAKPRQGKQGVHDGGCDSRTGAGKALRAQHEQVVRACCTKGCLSYGLRWAWGWWELG